ncbi:MAG: 3-isopropylmalate dehydratase large subunit [Kiritimatiellae bacterium]|nr:3-isopropylmalate dehydratase large subunit [Kiritimatiellia bacterium]
MSMTITEKILARAAGKRQVQPEENIWVSTDILLTHDVCGPGTIGVFQREFGREAKVWDPDKVVIIPDHYIFTQDEKARRNIDILREFVAEQGLAHYYDVGTPAYKGVCHVALAQEGYVRPGTVIFGTDSHTCTHGALGAFASGIGNTDAGFIMGTGKLLVKVPQTMRFRLTGEKPAYVMGKDIILRIIGDIGTDGATYRAMEFGGEAVARLSAEERMTICNMAVEAGAKNGIVEPDETTLDYLRGRAHKSIELVRGDADARVESEAHYDVATFEPCVAEPHSPGNYAPAWQRTHIKLDRAYIGSCTGGKLTDFAAAARILNGRSVSIDTYLVPATQQVSDALATEQIDGKALADIFREAGCRAPAPPSCAACLGGPVDTFGRTHGQEVVISTTNRNFIGRMGSKEAPIYLASPLTVAASAVTGHITDPRDFMT